MDNIDPIELAKKARHEFKDATKAQLLDLACSFYVDKERLNLHISRQHEIIKSMLQSLEGN